jgi:DNA recombination protein RmuC
VLGAVKTEFGKFGEALAHTRKKLDEATNSLGKAEVRTRQLTRKLHDVEALPLDEARARLGALEALETPEAPETPEAADTAGEDG